MPSLYYEFFGRTPETIGGKELIYVNEGKSNLTEEDRRRGQGLVEKRIAQAAKFLKTTVEDIEARLNNGEKLKW